MEHIAVILRCNIVVVTRAWASNSCLARSGRDVPSPFPDLAIAKSHTSEMKRSTTGVKPPRLRKVLKQRTGRQKPRLLDVLSGRSSGQLSTHATTSRRQSCPAIGVPHDPRCGKCLSLACCVSSSPFTFILIMTSQNPIHKHQSSYDAWIHNCKQRDGCHSEGHQMSRSGPCRVGKREGCRHFVSFSCGVGYPHQVGFTILVGVSGHRGGERQMEENAGGFFDGACGAAEAN
ncbi:hypothetical protein K469DRAFT_715698 [Zopfia rhizophila CBS 207.26]|uniref:Uncharacterized protein n=1 Tax=Zopfia rhizophila CBS 207.26 TaxID=1314779 RepID=A0A6A6DLT6_9PEZI|nr:hypothetical protein K469DRAFT_715698 [Zopfia rhizophila CBS 207.26]